MKYIRHFLLFAVFSLALVHRFSLFDQTGKDVKTYEHAVQDLFKGTNPYKRTVETYKDLDNPADHGYAYLPGLLYVEGFLYVIAEIVDVPFHLLWKIPILLADVGVGILLVRKYWQKSVILSLVTPALWFFNPYIVTKSLYTYSEPLVVFFMFLALIYLQKDTVLSGVFYSLSILFKTFPIILLPIFFIKSKDRFKFIAVCIIVGLFFSLPFMTSVDNFLTYLSGSVFVHNERYIQGRPFLFYISYFYNIEFFELVLFSFYSTISILGSWALTPVLYYVFKVRAKYVLSLFAFLCFYLFTPVFNRTYFLWFLPVFLVAVPTISKSIVKTKPWKCVSTIAVYALYQVLSCWYLVQWVDGFHIWHP